MNLTDEFHRPVLFDKIDPATTADDARAAKSKVEDMMNQTGLRHITCVCTIGGRYHINIMTEDPLPEDQAPAEYVDGVYVGVSRINSIDALLNPPTAPKPKR